jgi:hypothetical protein
VKCPAPNGKWIEDMQEAINTLMLVCAALASLALGVLVAYGMCRAAFAKLFRQAGAVAAQRAKTQIAPPVSQPDSL